MPRRHAAPVDCELHSEETLQGLDGPHGTVWESTGDHAGFRFGAPVAQTGLPAGWYALRGRIERLDGVVTLPSLHPSYEEIGFAEGRMIPLPEPSVSGELRALVLFTFHVSELRFCPGVLAARFRMHGFSLQRVSRMHALWMMLAGIGQNLSPWALMRRLSRFTARLCTAGLRAATVAAYSDYLKHQRPPGLTDYEVWIRRYDSLTPSRLNALQRLAAQCAGTSISLSVLLPVQGVPMSVLRRCIDSVREQLWRNWELCIVADASCDAVTMRVLKKYVAGDPRIRIARDPETNAIAAFNRALEMASASHVIVLGAGVELRRHALLEMADLLRRHGEVAFAYADEDWMDAGGRRLEPYFKPEWNPDLLRSHNYVGPFAMIRTDLVRGVGGVRTGYGESTWHDLFLRCTERLPRQRIHHVPHILYHRDVGGPEGPTRPGNVGAAEAATTELLAMDGAFRSAATRPGDVGATEAAIRSGLPALLREMFRRRSRSANVGAAKAATRSGNVGAAEAAIRSGDVGAAEAATRSGLPALLRKMLQRRRSSSGNVGAAEAATTELLAMDGAFRSAATRRSSDSISSDGARAVTAHLARLGVHADVDARPGRTFHVRWPLPSPLPKVCVVIPTRDRAGMLRACVESVLGKTTWSNFEIVVMDNQSSQRSALNYLDDLRKRDRIRVLRDDAPFNYAAINNHAVAQCDGELICLLNNDIEIISPDWLEEMAGHALRPEVGAVGAMLYYPDNTIQHAGVIVGMHGVADHIHAGRPRGWPGHGGRARVAQELSAVTGACLLVRRETYLSVGGLDERLAVAFNDVDFCLRLRERGFHNVWTPHAELYHRESVSRGGDDGPEQQARYAGEITYMRHRWSTMLRADPAYNPNLSLRASAGELAFPPRLDDAQEAGHGDVSV